MPPPFLRLTISAAARQRGRSRARGRVSGACRCGAGARAVAVALLAVVAAAGEPSADTPSARVASILSEVAQRPPDMDALLAQQIVKLGKDAVPVLFDRLERRAELALASGQDALPGRALLRLRALEGYL